MRKSIYLLVPGLAVVVAAALASAGLVVSAQNSNSSATMANASKPKPKHRKKAAPRSRCDNTKQEQTDLSGTYTGKVNYPDAGLAGDATLTITGNNFTLTAGSSTQSGRVTAVTTCGYTGATMMFGDLTPPAPGPNPPPPLPAVSLRAKKVGDHLTLTSVPGEPRKVSFTTAGSAKAKPRRHRAKAKTTTGATPTP